VLYLGVGEVAALMQLPAVSRSLSIAAHGPRRELSASCRRIHLPLGLGAVLTILGKTLKSYPILVTGISTLLIGGYGSKLTKSAGTLFRLGQVFLPLWSWWTRRRKRK
jgi:hypothetical protein